MNFPWDPLIVTAALLELSKFVIRAYFKLLEGNVPAPGLIPLTLKRSIEVLTGHVNILWSTLVTISMVCLTSCLTILFLTI